MTTATAAPKFRPFEFGVTRATLREAGGNRYLSADQPLGDYAHRMTDKLVHWATQTPDRTLFARRDPALGGDWRHISFVQALEAARSIGQALLDRGLSADQPLAIVDVDPHRLHHADRQARPGVEAIEMRLRPAPHAEPARNPPPQRVEQGERPVAEQRPVANADDPRLGIGIEPEVVGHRPVPQPAFDEQREVIAPAGPSESLASLGGDRKGNVQPRLITHARRHFAAARAA